MTAIDTSAERTLLVGMGETVFIRGNESARSVVGSCIGLVLCHRRQKLAAMAHIVLPEATGRPGLPGKFADTAIPYLIDLLGNEKAYPCSLVAMMAGGARMFGKTGPLQIGDANTVAVSAALEKLGIPIRGMSVGGTKGRKISFHGNTGELTVEIAGEPSFTL